MGKPFLLNTYSVQSFLVATSAALVFTGTDFLPSLAVMDAMKQKMKEEIEKQMGDNAPGPLKCCFPCCGGPVGTIEKFMFLVPKDQQDNVKSAIEKYKGL